MKRNKKLAILTALAMGVNFSSHVSASDTVVDVLNYYYMGAII